MKKRSIQEFITEIGREQNVHIKRNDIFYLKAYLDGWIIADPDSVSDLWLMGEFQNWIETKYQHSIDRSWADLLEFYSGNNSRTLQDFFILFEEFLGQIKPNIQNI